MLVTQPDDLAAEAGAPPRGRDTVEFVQQLLQIVFISGILTRVAGRANARFTAQVIDLNP